MQRNANSRQHMYTIATIVILGIVYELIVSLFVRPYIQKDSQFTPVVYGIIGVVLLFIFADTRRYVRQCMRRVLLNTSVPVEDIAPKIIAIFTAYTDKKELTREVKELLFASMGFERMRIFLRSEAKEFVSVLDEEAPPHDSMRLFLLDAHEKLPIFTRSDLNKHSDIAQYVEEEQVQLVVPLVIHTTLIGWIECSSKKYRLLNDAKHLFEELRPLLSITFHRVMLDVKFAIRIEQLIALNHISHTMNSSLNVKETLETIMDSIIDLLHVDRALMYLVSDDGKTCHPRIGRGLDENVRLDFSVEIDKSIFAHVMKYRQPIIVTDALHDDRVNKTYAAFVQTKSFVIVPMVSKERVIGIIGVDNLFSGKPVSEINVELLVTLANDATIALLNSRLYEQVNNFNLDLQRRIDEATIHLRSLLEMKSHFLSVASHQLRTPTTVIKGMLSMIEEDTDLPHDKIREFVHHAYVSSGRLERIVSELLSATELEDPQVRVNLQEVDIATLIHEIVEHLRPLAVQRGNEIIIKITEASILIQTDKHKLLEALANLIDNALRYTKNGTITIQVIAMPDEVTISVLDTGLGITTHEREIIFEKFIRGNESVEMDPNGTGLGLYIVKRTIEVLHGSVSVESEGRGKGSVFSITLPRKSLSAVK